jgi:phosphopantetheinyl transferase
MIMTAIDDKPLNKEGAPWAGLDLIQKACLGMILLPLKEHSCLKKNFFTDREQQRMEGMGPRRQKSYVAARSALKLLVRQLGLVKEDQTDRTIETLALDNRKPSLGESGLCCSVSHDARMVVAVADRYPIGVDIEVISGKAFRVLKSFWAGLEHDLVAFSPLGRERAATLAWTAKEAAAKALGLDLIQALREIKIIEMDQKRGLVRYHGKSFPLWHCEGDGQILSLVVDKPFSQGPGQCP